MTRMTGSLVWESLWCSISLMPDVGYPACGKRTDEACDGIVSWIFNNIHSFKLLVCVSLGR